MEARMSVAVETGKNAIALPVVHKMNPQKGGKESNSFFSKRKTLVEPANPLFTY